MTIAAAPGSIAWVGLSACVSAEMTGVPSARTTETSVVCGTRTPPLASAPYARTRSVGWTSCTPSAKARPAAAGSEANWTPIASACAATLSLPMIAMAFTAGMFSEKRRASRARRGPRSSMSALVGV